MTELQGAGTCDGQLSLFRTYNCGLSTSSEAPTRAPPLSLLAEDMVNWGYPGTVGSGLGESMTDAKG
jgi:hypothetical protein